MRIDSCFERFWSSFSQHLIWFETKFSNIIIGFGSGENYEEILLTEEMRLGSDKLPEI